MLLNQSVTAVKVAGRIDAFIKTAGQHREVKDKQVQARRLKRHTVARAFFMGLVLSQEDTQRRG